MHTLIKLEFNKIWKKRSTKIACGILLIVLAISPFLSRNEIRWYTNINEAPMTGKEALRNFQQGEKSIAGTLDDAYLVSFIDSMNREISGKEGQGEDVSASIVLTDQMMKYNEVMRLVGIPFSNSVRYSGYVDIFTELTNVNAQAFYSKWIAYVSLQQAEKGYDEAQVKAYLEDTVEPFTYDYAKGWQFASTKYMDLLLFISTVLIVALASSFSYERRSGVDAFMISSKLGKKHIVATKIKATLLYASLLYLVSLVVFYGSTFYVYGWSGAFTSVQASFPFAPIQWNVLQINIALIAFGFIGVWLMSIIVLFTSQIMKSTYKAQATSFILLYLSYILLVMDIGGIFRKILSLTPLGIVQEGFAHNFSMIKMADIWMYQPFFYAIVMLLIMLVLIIIIYRSFHHQETR